jgi:uncharacterized protein
MKKILIRMLKFYHRYISPLMPAACRFVPTCSEYTSAVIQKYGVLKGAWMGLKRIAKCHPFNPGGYDPVK